ncbi:MAG: patatin-like phospholipase family protein, partial [Eubacterium sp.]
MNETGLVLSGGGSRGSYQIGAYKALLDSDIKISAVVGTSIGAINGAYIAQGDFDKACNIWETLDYHRVFSETRGILMDVEPLRQLLNDTLSEKTIRNSPIHYGFTAFNLSKRKMEYRFIEDIPQGQLIDFIMASSNVPFFKRVIIDGNHYLDGGVYDPLPRKMIYDAGYRNIISIMIDINPYGASDHMQCDDLFEIRINHSESLGNFLSVNPALIKQNFDMGYYDTLRALNRCTGAHYYLLPKNYRNHPLARPFYKKDVRKLLLDPTSKSILTNNLSLRRLLVHMT